MIHIIIMIYIIIMIIFMILLFIAPVFIRTLLQAVPIEAYEIDKYFKKCINTYLIL